MVEQRLADDSRNQSRRDHNSVLDPRHHALPVRFSVHDDDSQTGLVVGRNHPAIAVPVDNNHPRALFRYAHTAQNSTTRTVEDTGLLLRAGAQPPGTYGEHLPAGRLSPSGEGEVQLVWPEPELPPPSRQSAR